MFTGIVTDVGEIASLKPAWTYHMRPPGREARGFASSENTPLVVGFALGSRCSVVLPIVWRYTVQRHPVRKFYKRNVLGSTSRSYKKQTRNSDSAF